MWAMRKADQWGIPDVDALLACLDNDQINEWMAYDRCQYSDMERQTANICYTMASLWCSGNQRPKYEDFLPRKRNAKPQSGNEVRAKMESLRNAVFKS